MPRPLIVGSVRGRNGGYLLARPPGEVTLREVIEAVEGPIDTSVEGGREAPSAQPRRLPRALAVSWREIGLRVVAALEEMTLGDMLRLDEADRSPMYHI